MHDWTITTDGSVSVLTMTSGENRLSATTLDSWSSALETMEAKTLASVKRRMYEQASTLLTSSR